MTLKELIWIGSSKKDLTKLSDEEKEYSISSGNVFADLGLPNPEERLAKAKLAIQINDLIDHKGITQTEAAKLLGIDQPKISALSTGRLSGFSLERLFRFLNILGQNVTIKISPKNRAKKPAQVIVAVPKLRKEQNIKPVIPSSIGVTIQARKKK